MEEISNPSTGFYQKKVVRSGPGFQSVTIVSSSSGGASIQAGSGNDLISQIFADMARFMGLDSSGDN